MVQNILDSLIEEWEMVEENKYGMIILCIKAIGKIIEPMEGDD